MDKRLLWNWTHYRVLAIEDGFPPEHIIEMLADLNERLEEIEDKEPNEPQL